MSTLFAAFAAIAVRALEFVSARVPETKGLSPAEIGLYCWRRCRGHREPSIPSVTTVCRALDVHRF